MQAQLLPGQQTAPAAPVPTLLLPESPLQVVGSTPLWLTGTSLSAVAAAVTNTVLPTEDAFHELYAGRADLVLGTLPPPAPPAGTSPPLSVPVGVFAVSVAYSLPGVSLRLNVPTLCALLSGQISRWNTPAVAALNPGVELPALPVLVSARTARNGVSLAVAGACVKAGVWPASQLKSNWSGGAAFRRAAPGAQRTDLNIPGTLALFALQATPPNLQIAALRSVGGSFALPRSELGLPVGGPSPTSTSPGQPLPGQPFPGQPFGVLPAVSVARAYPLRGLVWASVIPEQAYRGRSLERARSVWRLIGALRAASGRGVGGLAGVTVTPALKYNGRAVDGQTSRPGAPTPEQP
ncbi:hypothetical protein [Deinococcus altitudinis]|uniref:hypothetical protein n=1 Tax=Deinococcus altitudinis TaxID=468914 RepID=UPI00389192E8